MHYDVAVVGAGPAGSAAALAALRARPDARVLLLDRSDFPRDKPCGDGIAPQVVDALEVLSAGDPTVGFAPVEHLHLTGPHGSSVRRRLSRPTKVVPRAVFDSRLVQSATDRGAQFVRHTVRDVAVGRDEVVIDGRFAAHAVVAADGANGTLRRQLGVPPTPSKAVAIALRAYVMTNETDQRIVMAERGWPAYAWLFPIGDGRANVGYGMSIGEGVSRAALEDGLRRLLPQVGTLHDRRAHRLPLSIGRPRQPDGRVVLAGDAASLINPFTGEGIYYAVVSGAIAGTAALAGPDAGHRARVAIRRTLGRHLRHTALTYRLGTSPAMVDAAIRAADGDQGVFDTLVDLGLADGRLSARALLSTIRQLGGSTA
ncbi:MAG: geranylgeranyl reductase family protein [Candidatus Nanopelagicales bacterium]